MELEQLGEKMKKIIIILIILCIFIGNIYAISPTSQLTRKLFLLIFNNYTDIEHIDSEDEFFPVAFRGLPYFSMRKYVISTGNWNDMLFSAQTLDSEYSKLSAIQKRDIRLSLFFATMAETPNLRKTNIRAENLAYIVLSNLQYNDKYKLQMFKVLQCQNYMLKFPNLSSHELFELSELQGNEISTLYYMTLCRIKNDNVFDNEMMHEKLKKLFYKMIQNDVLEYQKKCIETKEIQESKVINIIMKLIHISSYFFSHNKYKDIRMQNDLFEFDRDNGIKYFDNKKRDDTIIYCDKTGKIKRKLPYTLTGDFLYVMDSFGDMCIGGLADAAFYNFKYLLHSCFNAGGDVSAAGELKLNDGYIVNIDNQSGHYKPRIYIFLQAVHNLIRRGFFNENTGILKIMIDGDIYLLRIIDHNLYFFTEFFKISINLNMLENKRLVYAA